MKLIHYHHPEYTGLPALSRWEPARRLFSGFEREFDQLFENALQGLDAGSARDRFPLDIYEDKDAYHVRADLPGVDRNDINIEMVDGFLTISATRKSTGRGGSVSEEVHFNRSVAIPDEVDAGKVSAKCEQGVLSVTLPKREEARPRKVSITVK